MRVQISLDGDDYAALKALADEEDRTVAGQARHMLRRALKNSQGEARAHEINAALQSLQPDASPDAKHQIKSPEAVAYVAKDPLPPHKEGWPLGNGDDLSSPITGLPARCEDCQAPDEGFHFEGCRTYIKDPLPG